MSEHLARYVLDAPSGRLLARTLEDMALAQAWYNSWLEEPGMADTFGLLPVRVAEWTADKVGQQRVTEGARQQPIRGHHLAHQSQCLRARGIHALVAADQRHAQHRLQRLPRQSLTWQSWLYLQW